MVFKSKDLRIVPFLVLKGIILAYLEVVCKFVVPYGLIASAEGADGSCGRRALTHSIWDFVDKY